MPFWMGLKMVNHLTKTLSNKGNLKSCNAPQGLTKRPTTHVAASAASFFWPYEDFYFYAACQRKGLERMLESPDSTIMVVEKQDLSIAMGIVQLAISTGEGGGIPVGVRYRS